MNLVIVQEFLHIFMISPANILVFVCLVVHIRHELSEFQEPKNLFCVFRSIIILHDRDD